MAIVFSDMYDTGGRSHKYKNGQLVPFGYDLNVKVKRVHPDAVIPEYATYGAAGFDLVAVEDVIIEPGETKLIPTGIAFEIPQGFEMQIRMRSGISKRTPLRLPNSVGTIDSDYRAEVFLMFENAQVMHDEVYTDGRQVRWVRTLEDNCVKVNEYVDDGSYIVRKGDRVAQAVIAPVLRANFEEVDELSETERGCGAFGSTGTR
ncbi:dUTP diphosphatase [Melghirimyces algeriensis]|uniref:dUTP diphosphatase n=1 Tax=Melghirimyces algeriensis TaxID=910412 RepID=A0A521F7K3_9BACL|nr:deoxyuridine 5'-triphosphate nucleotidohydrolase [Melghirimyces algeriensis]SMO92117.1 deoxyuridine 5'-triphosphate nucleotidohydrolase [Melghirimyces algeriensis]